MIKPTSEGRNMAIETPLGPDFVVLESMSGEESLSNLFRFDATVLSNDPDILGDDILGKNATVRVTVHDSEVRYFNGYVASFGQLHTQTTNLSRYQLELRPWFWFLTQTSDAHIFKSMTVQQIVEKVIGDHGFSEFKFSLSLSYDPKEYCVQYHETDFNFISRILEEGGIFYFFEHENGRHTLVFADDVSVCETVKGYEEIPFFPAEDEIHRLRDHVSEWAFKQSVVPGRFATNSYDFEKPTAKLLASAAKKREHDGSNFEIYDYEGNYKKRTEGERYASIRLAELGVPAKVVQGGGNARGITSGYKFDLTNYAREDQNRSYVALSIKRQMTESGYESGQVSEDYRCTFTAMDAQTPYRPARVTPKPEIRGPQTATVVGESGDEISVDEFGRVRVKFPWDRYAEDAGSSSCWIRVNQSHAGKGFGAVSLLRVGEEVIVNYINGDPDMPLITGRLYNGDNDLPYKLPGEKNVSGLKTNSTKQGNKNFNELRFDETKGSEMVYLQAEKDHELRIQNDRKELVENDRHLIVNNNKFEQVDNDRNEEIGNDHKEQIGKDRHITVKGLQAIKVSRGSTLDVGSDGSDEYGGDYSLLSKKDLYINAKNICIEGLENVTLKVGESSIAMTKTGIKIANAQGKVVLDSNMLEAKAKVSAKIQSKMTDVKGDAMLVVKGGMVKIN